MHFQNKVDLHTHSVFSNHATSTITENIDYSIEIGLKYLGLSDHQPDAKGKGASKQNFDAYKICPKERNGLKILKGIEFNVGPNFLDTINNEKFISKFDYGIASFHIYDYHSESNEKNEEYYFESIHTDIVKILGHIDDGRFPIDYRKVIYEANKFHKVIEINNASLAGINPRTNSIENITEIINTCKEFKCPVILNSDSHIKYDIGNVDLAYDFCKKLGLDENLILNCNLDLFSKYFII